MESIFLFAQYEHTISFISPFAQIICDAMFYVCSIPFSFFGDNFRTRTFVYILVCSFLQSFLKDYIPSTWVVFLLSFAFLVACSFGMCVRLFHSLLSGLNIQRTHLHTDIQIHSSRRYQMKNARNSMKVLWIFHGCTVFPHFPLKHQIAHGIQLNDNKCFSRNRQM